MKTIKLMLWTGACVALGIALATVDFGGKTPWQIMKGAWNAHSGQMDSAFDRLKGAVSGKSTPTERHSADDRRAIDQLIAKRAHNDESR